MVVLLSGLTAGMMTISSMFLVGYLYIGITCSKRELGGVFTQLGMRFYNVLCIVF